MRQDRRPAEDERTPVGRSAGMQHSRPGAAETMLAGNRSLTPNGCLSARLRSHRSGQKASFAARRLGVNAEQVGHEQLTSGPLSAVGRGEWSPKWQQSFIEAVRGLILAAENVQRSAKQLASAIGLPDLRLDRRRRTALASLATHLPSAAGHDWSFVLRPDAQTLFVRMPSPAEPCVRFRARNNIVEPPIEQEEVTRMNLTVVQVTQSPTCLAKGGPPPMQAWDRISVEVWIEMSR